MTVHKFPALKSGAPLSIPAADHRTIITQVPIISVKSASHFDVLIKCENFSSVQIWWMLSSQQLLCSAPGCSC